MREREDNCYIISSFPYVIASEYLNLEVMSKSVEYDCPSEIVLKITLVDILSKD